jgi:hypothetical protein
MIKHFLFDRGIIEDCDVCVKYLMTVIGLFHFADGHWLVEVV